MAYSKILDWATNIGNEHAIFHLIPGAGVYYTMKHAVHGNMDLFASSDMHTAAIAGGLAVGILLVSTTVRMVTV